jgi:acyl-CoA synthetase (AMP-forming)/AMP-acid ligase II
MLKYQNLIEALECAPGDRTFLTMWYDIDEQDSVTFDQFRQQARGMAKWLQLQGVETRDFVVLVMPQGIAGMAAFAGAMMLGAVPSFLAYPSFKMNPAKYRTGLAGVTANLKAKVVVIDHAFPEELLGYVAVEETGIVLRCPELLPTEPSAHAFTTLDSSQIAFLQHSAGTTGLQKGVALTHSKVLRQLDRLGGALQLEDFKDCIISWLPLYHDMGLIASFMLPMVFHIPLVMLSPLEWVMRPQSMLEAITQHHCTLAWQPNFAFQFLARRTPQADRELCDLSSMRAFINCSEPIRANSMDEFYLAFSSCGLKEGAVSASYAMAENVFAVSQEPVSQSHGPARVWADAATFRAKHLVVPVAADSEDNLCFVSSGKLLPGMEVRIVDEAGSTLSPTQVGEILLRTDCLFECYWNRPDLTAEALIDGWYQTGDLGFLLDGNLYVVGRKKDLLIIAGENYYAQDIEEIVFADEDIHDGRAIAIGAFNAALGTQEIVVVAEVQQERLLENAPAIEQRIRSAIVQALGVVVRAVLLKPPHWIVKSTAGKPARTATKERLQKEHPEFDFEL